jgi:hypothetical protein
MRYLNSSTALVNPAPITGQYLAHSSKGLIRRAFDAADLHTGTTVLVTPTVVQCAMLACVNETYVHWAMAIKRLAGLVPLVPPSARAIVREAPGSHNLPVPTIAIPDFELVNFIRCIGIDRMLNAMIAAETIDN